MTGRTFARGLVRLCGVCVLALLTNAAAADPIALIVDTDIGSDVDDAFAMGVALARSDKSQTPAVQIVGITTCGSDASKRAMMVCRMLTASDREEIPVAVGADRQPQRKIGAQNQYFNHPDVIFNRTKKPGEIPAHDFIYQQIKLRPKQITLVAIGPLTNIAIVFAEHPDAKELIGRVIVAGGESNFTSDIGAARTVVSAGAELLVVPGDASRGLKPSRKQLAEMFTGSQLSNQVRTFYQLSDEQQPPLLDTLALLLALDPESAKLESRRVEVDDAGKLRIAAGSPSAQVATSVDGKKALDAIVNSIGNPKLPRAKPDPPPKNLASPIAEGKFPRQVHAFEDYETDIERRWWMTGKLETQNVPSGSRRACRGVLTHDFDDLLGNRRAMYTSVIFNPVPGPPMGPRTRLSFRYWIKGEGGLRVQLYSLTRGFHRNLVLTDLPQGKWQSATVDMTQMRRPDGSGGPLAEDERIDDIQFYADPRAELLIDDIVLYEAADEAEKRPFPRRILFTAWFDTGKQGVEWPGDLELVPHVAPLRWKAAKSVANPKTGAPWLRIKLRGPRELPPRAVLQFRYLLAGPKGFRIELARGDAVVVGAEFETAVSEKWAHATLVIEIPAAEKGTTADEIRFLLPSGSELLVDDLLLYEPAMVANPTR